ncbi:MAG: histidine--tRNA ligase [Candidatus Anstonellales archaeon]
MVSFARPRGMKDFFPSEMKIREQVIESIRETFRTYGYLPFDTPSVERLDVLERKGGDEIEGQIFRIEGDLGLRFDLTVPLARVCGGNQFVLPFKRYAIGPVWRREEPQRGRMREFYQADIDIVGSARPECEAELLSCANDCIERLGFQKPRIRINSRKVLDSLCKKFMIEDKKKSCLLRILDKKNKVSDDQIKKEMIDCGISQTQVENILSFIGAKMKNEEALEAVRQVVNGKEVADEIERVLALCKDYGISPAIDLSLVRGLAYYTGMVFEMELGREIGSVAGGGRYDNLVGLFGRNLPAVGISLGVERLCTLLEEKKGRDESVTYAKVYVAAVREEFSSYARKVAVKLRRNGIPCETDTMGRNLARQIEYAKKLGIPFVIIVGEKETKEDKVTLRELESGMERMLKVDDVGDAIEEKNNS